MAVASLRPRSLRRPAPSRWAPVGVALAFAGGALAAMVIANAMVGGAVFHPGCGLKWATGLPCPGCGGTHSLAAMAHGDWSAALAFNPLVALGAMLAGAALPLTWLDVATNRARGVAVLRRVVRTRSFRWALIALMVVNWVWLAVEGR